MSRRGHGIRLASFCRSIVINLSIPVLLWAQHTLLCISILNETPA